MVPDQQMNNKSTSVFYLVVCVVSCRRVFLSNQSTESACQKNKVETESQCNFFYENITNLLSCN